MGTQRRPRPRPEEHGYDPLFGGPAPGFNLEDGKPTPPRTGGTTSSRNTGEQHPGNEGSGGRTVRSSRNRRPPARGGPVSRGGVIRVARNQDRAEGFAEMRRRGQERVAEAVRVEQEKEAADEAARAQAVREALAEPGLQRAENPFDTGYAEQALVENQERFGDPGRRGAWWDATADLYRQSPLDADMSGYYDNALRQASEGITSQLAGSGLLNSSQTADQISEVATNLAAQRALEEANFDIARSQDEIARLGLGGQLAGDLDQMDMDAISRLFEHGYGVDQFRRGVGRDFVNDNFRMLELFAPLAMMGGMAAGDRYYDLTDDHAGAAVGAEATEANMADVAAAEQHRGSSNLANAIPLLGAVMGLFGGGRGGGGSGAGSGAAPPPPPPDDGGVPPPPPPPWEDD